MSGQRVGSFVGGLGYLLELEDQGLDLIPGDGFFNHLFWGF
jgi:hypothetical protein